MGRPGRRAWGRGALRPRPCRRTSGVPLGTLGINLTGSFLLAFLLAGPATQRLPPELLAALAVGLLGAYTTFSTFSHETVVLLRAGRSVAAGAYVAASLLGGLGAADLGHALGQSLIR